MMPKRFIAILIIFILFTGSSAACSPGVKMVKKDLGGTATLTPFLSKATFTITNTPIKKAGNESVNAPSFTETIDVGDIARGMYYLRLRSDEQELTKLITLF